MSWGKVGYYAKRLGYASWEGAKDLVRSYDPRTWDQKEAAQNVAKDYALGKAGSYYKLVKAGAAVGKVGRVAFKAVPVVGVLTAAPDAATFFTGFWRGWQAYGVNHR